MPTPYGSRGGMAFSAAELHVLRRSLAHALQSSTAPLPATAVQDCLRLAQAVDEAVREAGRLRAFLAEDLGRYRAALPGSLVGYLELLREALAGGYEPVADDLAALRALRGNPGAAALLASAEEAVHEAAQEASGCGVRPWPGAGGAPRARLLALAGGKAATVHRSAGTGGRGGDRDAGQGGGRGGGRGGRERSDRGKDKGEEPRPVPAEPKPAPERPIPTPGEVFPPRRKPTPPPAARRAAG
ncbi:hypothetical protein [Streptomyces sp. NPDC090022]|uniref:hypothetical protein n=1 Tax=Streptomyces sp. NPDC090022 TaxID=3365920 RepID=UPI0038156608